MRRLVTGVDGSGKSVIVSDADIAAKIPPVMLGTELWTVWGADETPTVPTDGTAPVEGKNGLSYFPTKRGAFRYGICTIPPESALAPPPSDMEAAIAESKDMLPGLLDFAAESDAVHATPTIDLEYFISGEIELELDDGVTTTVRAGDVVIQNGSRHSWHNRSKEPVTFLIVFIGTDIDESKYADH